MNYVTRVMVAIAVSALITAGGVAFAIIPGLLLDDLARNNGDIHSIVRIFCPGLVAVIAFCIIVANLELAKGKWFWLLTACMFLAFCVGLPFANKILHTDYIFKLVACTQFCMCIIAGFAIIFRDELAAALKKNSKES